MNETKRTPWGFWLIVLGLTLMMGYVSLLPWLEQRLSGETIEPGIHFVEHSDFYEQVRLRGIAAILAVGVFALGSCIGSYLNVLVYRMPLGKSVMWERSHCPSCQQQILGQDNVPILGWLQLNGRCRSCDLPISSRYPLVEATVAGLFLLLFLVELYSGGANLPGRVLPHDHHGLDRILMFTQWDLVRLFLFHCFLLTTILTWSLIQYDQNRVPRYSIVTAIFLAIGLTSLWPDLQVMPLQTLQDRWNSELAVGLSTSLLGGLIGWQLGMLLIQSRKLVRFPEQHDKTQVEVNCDRPEGSLILTGLVLGWQGVLSSSILAVLLRQLRLLLLSPRSKFHKWPWSGDLLVAVVLHLIFWRWLCENGSPWWPGSQTDWTGIALTTLAFSFLVVTSQYQESDQRLTSSEPEPFSDDQPDSRSDSPSNSQSNLL